MGHSYEVVADRLTSEASTLFREMVAAHLEVGRGDRRFMLWKAMQGNGLIFVAESGRQQEWSNIDPGALDDLLGYGLLSVTYGGGRSRTPNYRITGEGLAFYRWWMAQQGSALDQVDTDVRRVIEGDAFAAKHAGGAHHLREAFALLWQDRLDDQAVSEIGDHLRKALMDTVTDVAGDAPGKQEKPIERLRDWVSGRDVNEREQAVLDALVELARATLRLDHRLNHIRDEADLDQSPATKAELRRAAIATAVVCDQLSSL